MPISSLSFLKIRPPAGRLAAALFATLGLAACDDPLGLRASLAVRFDTLSVFAMTGTPVTYPAAYNVGIGTIARVDSDVAFDVAFDLTGTGQVRLIPARLISATRNLGGFPSATPRVGLQRHSGSFESLTKAPNGNYTYDSTLVVAPGDAVAIEVMSDACQFSLSSLIYAKLVVDSIDTSSRLVYFRATRDPNCGFRSLQPGVPKD